MREQAESLVLYRACTIPPGETTGIWSAGWLTGYTAELIAADAARRGAGTRIEVRVPASISEGGASVIGKRLARLAGRGILVRVCRDARLTAGAETRVPAGR